MAIGQVAEGHLGEDVGGDSPPTGGVLGATPRNFFQNQPSLLQSVAFCGVAHCCNKQHLTVTSLSMRTEPCDLNLTLSHPHSILWRYPSVHLLNFNIYPCF